MTKVRKSITALIILALLIGLYISYLYLTDFDPEDKVQLPIYYNQVKALPLDEPISITTWNIGYGGLDAFKDKYRQKGKGTRASSLENVMENLDGITETIDQINPDILFFQELDIKSSRSFKIDELDYFSEKYPHYNHVFGGNFNVAWIPFPLFRPLGRVESGLAIFSRFGLNDSYRYSLPGQEDGFFKFFDYDRCLILNEYELANDKSLIVANLHLSDFEQTGQRRHDEFSFLKEFLNELKLLGNYIIVGGDWNHNLPNTDPYYFESDEEWPTWLKNIPEDFEIDGFKWAVTSFSPTVRNLNKPFEKNSSFLAVTSGFLVSDNVEIVDVKTLNLDFQHSYHNPVTLNFLLK